MERPEIVDSLRRRLLEWFALNRRPLPWRAGYAPYDVWIAEMMMQQTQMDRGVRYFLRWKERFPDVKAVAEADEQDLLAAWEGLGYYRRVAYIRSAARAIVERHGSVFPDSYEEILALPGIGPYTAGAIACTAFNLPHPCVDGNVERVLSRVYDIGTPVRAEPAGSRIRMLARELIPHGKARDFNQALMELGALVCGRQPRCGECPLADLCLACIRGVALERPVTAARRISVKRSFVAVVFVTGEGVFLTQRPGDAKLWASLWEFPTEFVPDMARIGDVLSEMIRRHTGGGTMESVPLPAVRHKYTTNDATLHPFVVRLPRGAAVRGDGRTVPLCGLEGYPMSAPQRRVAESLSKASLFLFPLALSALTLTTEAFKEQV